MFLLIHSQKYYYRGPVIDEKTQKVKRDKFGRVETTWCRKDVDFYEHLGIPTSDAKTLVRVMQQSMLFDGDPLWKRHKKLARLPCRLGLMTVINYALPTYVISWHSVHTQKLMSFVDSAGDMIDTVFEISLILNALAGRPGRSIIIKMSMNTALDFVISLPPVLGAILGHFYRSNTKNALLLEKALIKRAKKAGLDTEKAHMPQNGSTIDAHDHSPPRRAVNHESDMVSRESTHGSKGRLFMQEKPAKLKTDGWASGFGKLRSRKEKTQGVDVALQRPIRPEQRSQARSQGSRFISVNDL